MKFGIAWTAEVRNNPEFVSGEVSMLRAQEKLFFHLWFSYFSVKI